MIIQPLGNRVVVKPIEKKETTDGIYIPDSIKDKPIYFEVVAIGEGWYSEDGTIIPINNVKVGDQVLIERHTGIEIKKDDGTSVRVVNAAEILAIIKD